MPPCRPAVPVPDLTQFGLLMLARIMRPMAGRVV